MQKRIKGGKKGGIQYLPIIDGDRDIIVEVAALGYFVVPALMRFFSGLGGFLGLGKLGGKREQGEGESPQSGQVEQIPRCEVYTKGSAEVRESCCVSVGCVWVPDGPGDLIARGFWDEGEGLERERVDLALSLYPPQFSIWIRWFIEGLLVFCWRGGNIGVGEGERGKGG